MDETQGIQILRQRYSDRLSVGFTGTRRGMTLTQWNHVEQLLENLYKDCGGRQTNQWHDGDCVGADRMANSSVRQIIEWGYGPIQLVGHPCNLEKYRAYNEFDLMRPIKPPLARNKDIVNESDVMIAAPYEFEELVRGSGTWATIRYTSQTEKPLFIVWPDATCTFYESGYVR